MLSEKELLEKLSDLEHQQWMEWSSSLKKELVDYASIMYTVVNSYDYNNSQGEEYEELIKKLWDNFNRLEKRIQRWIDLQIPYTELTEDYKDDDRVYARKIIDLLKKERVYNPNSRLNNKIELLYRLYPVEYDCKISGFTTEADKIHCIIKDLETENFNGTNRKTDCAKNCSFSKQLVYGHGLMEHICTITGETISFGKPCTVSEEEYNKWLGKE